MLAGMERFFRVIRRLNSILFLLVLLGTGGSTVWYATVLYQWRHPRDVAVAAEDEADPILLGLGDAETVTGTGTLMLRLTGEGHYRRSEEIRNILFLSIADHRGTWLFPSHDNLILETDQIRPWRADDLNAPTRALYFQFVPGDPEHAMGPSQYDPFTIALAKSDGSGLVAVLQDVDEVLSYQQFDADSLSIVYRDLEELRLARVSLDSFAKLSDERVIDVPDQLGQ
jgi:hypothetical protein